MCKYMRKKGGCFYGWDRYVLDLIIIIGLKVSWEKMGVFFWGGEEGLGLGCSQVIYRERKRERI